MREIRTCGSEGGEAPQGAFPTLIQQGSQFTNSTAWTLNT